MKKTLTLLFCAQTYDFFSSCLQGYIELTQTPQSSNILKIIIFKFVKYVMMHLRFTNYRKLCFSVVRPIKRKGFIYQLICYRKFMLERCILVIQPPGGDNWRKHHLMRYPWHLWDRHTTLPCRAQLQKVYWTQHTRMVVRVLFLSFFCYKIKHNVVIVGMNGQKPVVVQMWHEFRGTVKHALTTTCD